MCSSILPDPTGLHLVAIEACPDGVTIVVRANNSMARCPECGSVATRVHSCYLRTPIDLPWQGIAARLRLHTRRWFCPDPTCTRRIFTERLPAVVAPHGRRTVRLAKVVEYIALMVGGEPGSRVLASLGLSLRGQTLLNAVRRTRFGDVPTPKVLGIDDWSIRKGRTYGTILVDLERHSPIDLLSDRSSASVAEWLRAHPGVEIVCRDRGGEYAEGARLGAPGAVQVADRWHLLSNLGDAVERVLVRNHSKLGSVRLQGSKAPDPPKEFVQQPVLTVPRPPTRREREKGERDGVREARHREIHRLRTEGYGVRATARHLRISPITARKYLASPRCPHPTPRHSRVREIDRHVSYLRERWEQGEHRVGVLWEEIRRRGFGGAPRRVQEVLSPWRAELCEARKADRPPRRKAPEVPAGRRLSPRCAASLLLKSDGALKPAQSDYIRELLEECPELGSLRTLGREFSRIVRERDVAALERWLDRAESCEVGELREFMAGIRRDRAAVEAALAYEWSSGQVEGQITRLNNVSWDGFDRHSLPSSRSG